MADLSQGILPTILSFVDSRKREISLRAKGAIEDPEMALTQLLSNIAETVQKGATGSISDLVGTFGGVGAIKTLYHGGRPFTKWDPATIGSGEGGILAQGPGLYAAEKESLAKVYLQYGGKEAEIKKLLVEDANIIDPAKKLTESQKSRITNAELALDDMGFRASRDGIRNALLMKSGRYDKEAVRKVLVDNGIDGFKQNLGNDFGHEYVIFNPAAIKPEAKFDSAKGIGQTPYNQDIGYFGFETMMPVSKFQRLHAPIEKYNQESVDFLKSKIIAGEPLGQPMLYAEWNGAKNTWDVLQHEGRHRAEAVRQLLGDDAMIPVHIKPSGASSGLRASTIVPDMKLADFRSESKVSTEKLINQVNDLLDSLK